MMVQKTHEHVTYDLTQEQRTQDKSWNNMDRMREIHIRWEEDCLLWRGFIFHCFGNHRLIRIKPQCVVPKEIHTTCVSSNVCIKLRVCQTTCVIKNMSVKLNNC